SSLGTSLATGDIGQGVAVFAERLSGLGLAAGIGVGVAVGLFQNLRERVEEATEAAENLHKELGKPIDVLGGLGAEGLTAQIDKLTKAGEENADKQKSFGSRVRDFVLRSAPGGAGILDKGANQESDQFVKGLAHRSQLRADAELKIANIKLQAV